MDRPGKCECLVTWGANTGVWHSAGTPDVGHVRPWVECTTAHAAGRRTFGEQ